MKKFLGIVVLGLLLVPAQVKAGPIGSGEVKLKPQAVKAWIKYVKQKNQPRIFLVPIDGSSAFWWYCPSGVTCVPGGTTQEIRKCERFFKGKECKIFAKRRTIKWNNRINKGNKESRFNSKMSESEIKAKLKELGFLGETTSTTTKVEKKKKTEETKTTSASLSKELKELSKLYEDGVLTKEEFEKSKKKLLN